MTLTQVLYALAVEEHLNFSAAARSLFVSQPALSASVKKVEKNLGITIFDRSTNPITVTPAGRVCIESIEKILPLYIPSKLIFFKL